MHDVAEVALPVSGALSVRPFRGRTGLAFAGDADLTAQDVLHEALAALHPDGAGDIHLDLTEAGFIDACCTRELIALARRHPAARLVVHHPPASLRRIAALLGPADQIVFAGPPASVPSVPPGNPHRARPQVRGDGARQDAGCRPLAPAGRAMRSGPPVSDIAGLIHAGQVRIGQPTGHPDPALAGAGPDLTGADLPVTGRLPGPVPARDGTAGDPCSALLRQSRELRARVAQARSWSEQVIGHARQAAAALATTHDHGAAALLRLAAQRPAASAQLTSLSQAARSQAEQLRGHTGHPGAPQGPAVQAAGRTLGTDTLRRATAFINDQAGEDITVTDIAAASFVTVRAVQLAFRRHLDTTPLGYLRQVRLERAHRDLLTAVPGRDTVTTIAARWRFPSASRFSAYYRAAYGVPPGHTLRHHPPAGPGTGGRPPAGRGRPDRPAPDQGRGQPPGGRHGTVVILRPASRAGDRQAGQAGLTAAAARAQAMMGYADPSR